MNFKKMFSERPSFLDWMNLNKIPDWEEGSYEAEEGNGGEGDAVDKVLVVLSHHQICRKTRSTFKWIFARKNK